VEAFSNEKEKTSMGAGETVDLLAEVKFPSICPLIVTMMNKHVGRALCAMGLRQANKAWGNR
jgi:hypothetical protein